MQGFNLEYVSALGTERGGDLCWACLLFSGADGRVGGLFVTNEVMERGLSFTPVVQQGSKYTHSIGDGKGHTS